MINEWKITIKKTISKNGLLNSSWHEKKKLHEYLRNLSRIQLIIPNEARWRIYSSVTEPSHHWFSQWLGAKLTTSHQLNQWWLRMNWGATVILQWNINRSTKIFFQQNVVEEVVWNISSISFKIQCQWHVVIWYHTCCPYRIGLSNGLIVLWRNESNSELVMTNIRDVIYVIYHAASAWKHVSVSFKKMKYDFRHWIFKCPAAR